MNYQFGWYLFLRPRTFFIALFLCSFALLGVTAGAVWLIIMGLIYPVAVSMRLHILGQNKAVMLRQTCSEWIVYLPGIPVQEQQSALINAAFPSETALRRFYIRALTSKLILHAVTLSVLWLDAQHAAPTWYWMLAAFITLTVLMKSMSSTLLMLRKVVRRQYSLCAIHLANPWYEFDLNEGVGLRALWSVK